MTLNQHFFRATAMPDRDWWQALWPDPDVTIKALGVDPGMLVVDLGCGDGYFTGPIARRAAPGHVIGLDVDPAMLEQAKTACADVSNCAWQAGDAAQVSRLLRVPVDYVLIANAFHGAPDKTGLAREVASILKPGGRFAIVNWYPIPREETRVLGQPRGPSTELRMSPEQTRAAVEPAGFAFERLVKLGPYHYGAIYIRTGPARAWD